MASIQKSGNGYRVFLCINGVRKSKTFRTRREAKAWSDQQATDIRIEQETTPSEVHTLKDAVLRYQQEESPKKRGQRWEIIRLDAMLKDKNFPSSKLMGDLTADLFAAWRDARLRQVQPGSVLREISLISDLFETARIEWKWISANPMREIRKPKAPDHREVVITPGQVRAMLKAMKYSPLQPVDGVAQAVAVCFLTALRTGMRAGDLTKLTWDQVFDDYCHLPITKTKKRNVPLTRKAIRLIEKMRGYDKTFVFSMKPQSLDANFRKYRDRAGLEGFTFHDTRHTAATMLARKIDVLDLCRMFGWTSTKQALVYYNPTASSIAGLLNR